MRLVRAKWPFHFKTQLSLVLVTGLKATDLSELRKHLTEVPESSVYYHTHCFLQQHQFMTPEPPNDFAYWVTDVLQENELGERLAAIDTIRFQSLADLRKAIVSAINDYLEENPNLRKAPKGEEFNFMKSILFSLPSSYYAYDLKEFSKYLQKVNDSALYYHVFEGRLRQESGQNDFSYWLATSLGEKNLADKIDRLDPYTHTVTGLKKKIVGFVEERLTEMSGAKN